MWKILALLWLLTEVHGGATEPTYDEEQRAKANTEHGRSSDSINTKHQETTRSSDSTQSTQTYDEEAEEHQHELPLDLDFRDMVHLEDDQKEKAADEEQKKKAVDEEQKKKAAGEEQKKKAADENMKQKEETASDSVAASAHVVRKAVDNAYIVLHSTLLPALNRIAGGSITGIPEANPIYAAEEHYRFALSAVSHNIKSTGLLGENPKLLEELTDSHREILSPTLENLSIRIPDRFDKATRLFQTAEPVMAQLFGPAKTASLMSELMGALQDVQRKVQDFTLKLRALLTPKLL